MYIYIYKYAYICTYIETVSQFYPQLYMCDLENAWCIHQATGLTALDARENDFDLMGVQMEALKTGARR